MEKVLFIAIVVGLGGVGRAAQPKLRFGVKQKTLVDLKTGKKVGEFVDVANLPMPPSLGRGRWAVGKEHHGLAIEHLIDLRTGTKAGWLGHQFRILGGDLLVRGAGTWIVTGTGARVTLLDMRTRKEVGRLGSRFNLLDRRYMVTNLAGIGSDLRAYDLRDGGKEIGAREYQARTGRKLWMDVIVPTQRGALEFRDGGERFDFKRVTPE